MCSINVFVIHSYEYTYIPTQKTLSCFTQKKDGSETELRV